MAKERKPNAALRYERANRGWSQQFLAERLDTTDKLVSDWERGIKTPGKEHQRGMCELFGKTAEELGFLPKKEGEANARLVVTNSSSNPENKVDLSAATVLWLVTTHPSAVQALVEQLQKEAQSRNIPSVVLEEDQGLSASPEKELHESILADPEASLVPEEANEGLALPASPSTDLTPVTSCVWQPPTPAIQTYIASNPVRHFWQIAHTDYDTPGEMTAAIQAAIKDMNMTTGDNITRRDALCELASIPMIALGKTHTLKASCYEEMLRFCTAALEGCWELYRSSDLMGVQRAFDCVCTYMPLLETIAHDSSRLRYQALDLATRYALLQWLLGWECMYPWEVVSYAQNALSLSKETGNISLQLSAHTKLSWNYLISRSYTDAWKTMQEGEHALTSYQREKRGPSLPSGMIGNFYSGYARAQVYNGIDPDTALGIATNSEPLSGQVAFVSFGASVQSCEAAWTYNAKGNSKQAMEWLEKAIDPNTFSPRIHASQSTSGRVGTMNLLTSALLQSKDRDMKHIIRAWTVGMEGAQALKNEIKYQEAMTNFAIMRSLWSGEDAISRLMPLTSHW